MVVTSKINYCPSIYSIPEIFSSGESQNTQNRIPFTKVEFEGFYFKLNGEDQESISHKYCIGKSYGQLFLATAVRSLMSN